VKSKGGDHSWRSPRSLYGGTQPIRVNLWLALPLYALRLLPPAFSHQVALSRDSRHRCHCPREKPIDSAAAGRVCLPKLLEDLSHG
jgi:hypothetical protein